MRSDAVTESFALWAFKYRKHVPRLGPLATIATGLMLSEFVTGAVSRIEPAIAGKRIAVSPGGVLPVEAAA